MVNPYERLREDEIDSKMRLFARLKRHPKADERTRKIISGMQTDLLFAMAQARPDLVDAALAEVA
jgi:hypothetical protein